MCSIPVGPASRKLDLDLATTVNRAILDLNSFEFTRLVRHQIKRAVLRHWQQYRKALLEQVQLSLQDSQITLVLGVMSLSHDFKVTPGYRRSTGFHGIAISITC